MIKKYLSIRKIIITQFVSYVFIVLILMGKASIHPMTVYVGDSSDSGQIMWYMSNFWKQVLSGHSILYTSMMNYPSGVNLMDNTSMIAFSLILGWVGIFTNYIFAFNLMFFFNQLVAMLAFKEILSKLRVSNLMSYLGGGLIAIIPYASAQELGHPNLYIISPLLLIVLNFIVIYQGFLSKDIKNKNIQFLLLAITISIEFYTSLEVTVTFMLASLIFVLFLLLYKRESVFKFIVANKKQLLIAIISCAVLFIPGIYIFLLGPYHLSGDQLYQPFDVYVTDVANMFIPSNVYLIASKASISLSNNFTGNISEWDGYIGIPMLITFIWGVQSLWRNVYIRAMFFSSVVLFVFSLGPQLHVMGLITSLKLPWVIIEHIKLLGDALPNRLMLYVDLIVLIIVIIAIDEYISNNKKSLLKLMVICIDIILIILFWIPNLPKTYYSENYFLLNKKVFFGLINKSPSILITGNISHALFSLSFPSLKFPIANAYAAVQNNPSNANNFNDVLFQITNLFNTNQITENQAYKLYNFEFRVNLQYLVKNKLQFLIFFPSGGFSMNNALYSVICKDLGLPRYSQNGIYVWKVKSDKIKSFSEFDLLYMSAISYLKAGGHLNGLYPLFLESKGYLPNYLSGFPLSNPAYNWTLLKDGWLGSWGANNFGVGIITHSANARLIINKYKGIANDIYFPFPQKLNLDNYNNQQGELLVIFNNKINH